MCHKKSNFLRAIVAITMMFTGWLPSLAHDFEVDGIFYNKTSDNTAAVTYKGDSYSSYFGDIVIPSSVDYNGATYSVTSIGEGAFGYCTSLTSIEIGNSVTSIGDWAFFACSNLTGIEIPNSVTSIGDRAFWDCSSLTSIEIPNSVTSIGEEAFGYCTSLTSIEIGNSVTSIGYIAFGSCENLTNIVVDAGNSKYDSRNGCNAIIETASNTLIVGCQNTIIPNNVTSIGDYAFYWCTSLTSIQIPNSVTSIGEGAFVYCSSLTRIEIPNSVTSIGDEAFAYCESLTSVEIPNSVTSIGISAFDGCSSLTSIVVDAGNSKYDSRNGCNAIIETASNTLIAGCQNTIIPNSVTSIGDYAFHECKSLTGIEIPNSVTSIGEWAFSYCYHLTGIEIPNSVTSIGDYAFNDCTSLTKITCWATTPPAIYSNTFSNYSADLYVPVGCKIVYQSANYWKNFNIINDTLDAPITLNDNDVTVATIGENIVVKNATVGSVVRVYAVDGAMIATGVATDGDIVVEVPAKGIYVVTVGKQAVKVII